MTQVMNDYRTVSRIPPHKARALTSRLLAGVVVVALGGCAALHDPYVSMGTEVPYRPSHETAVSFARDKAKELTDRRDQLEKYEVSTGALALGSGIAGLAFAAFGAHSDAILGAGLVGGGAYGAGAYLPSQKRKTIYTKGAKAIECAIKATSIGLEDRPETAPKADAEPKTESSAESMPKSLGSPQVLAPAATVAQRETAASSSFAGYLKDLKTLTGGMTSLATAGSDPGAKSNELRGSAPLAKALKITPTLSTRSGSPAPLVRRAAVFEAEATLLDRSLVEAMAAGRELAATLDALTVDRGGRLISATSDVLAAVSDQLDTTRVDPDAALKAMRDGSLALVDGTKTANKKVQAAVADTEEEALENKQALADVQAEGAKSADVAAASEAIEAKAALAGVIAAKAEGLQQMVDDQTSCLRELTGDDDGGAES